MHNHHSSPHPQKAPRGFSLVETLVGIGLLGIVLVPMLLMSSAYFLQQLSKTRQSMEVSHNTAQFLNRFMEELYQTPRIISASSSEITFSYFDAVAQRETKIGYRLTPDPDSSNLILERLQYNTASKTWDAISPYSETDSHNILLPPGTTFTYCQDTATPCTPASSAQEALLVRLTGWTFQNRSNTQSLPLPDLDIYLSASASTSDGAILSETPKELYMINAASAFGGDADLRLFGISSYTGQLTAMSTTPGITTIISNVPDIGTAATIEVDPITGRIFLARGESRSNVWTWHSATGLSTIFTGGVSARGRFKRRPDTEYGWNDDPFRLTNDGTLIMAERDSTGTGADASWAWKDGVLSTIVNNTNAAGHGWGYRHLGIGSDGRVYITPIYGEELWTWKNGVQTYIGLMDDPEIDELAPAGTDRFFWRSGKKIYRWTAPNTVDTVFTTGGTATQNNIREFYARVDGRLFYTTCDVDGSGNCTGNYRTCTWKDGTETVIANQELWPTLSADELDGTYLPGGQYQFFNMWGAIWRWSEAEGLVTMSTSADGFSEMLHNGNGRLVMVSHADDNVTTWKADTGVTVVPGGTIGASWYKNPVAFVGNTDVFYFGKNNGRIYRWEPPNTLTTVTTGFTVSNAARYGRIAADSTGRVYFSGGSSDENTNSVVTSVWTWHPDTGMSTILSNIATFAYSFKSHPHGGVYFCGKVSGSDNCYYWAKNLGGLNLQRATDTGAPSQGKSYTFNFQGSNYTSLAETSDGNFFFLDSSAKTIEYYTGTSDSNGNKTYSRQSYFSWGGHASTVGAIAINEGTTSIALLDTGNKQVDVYANRLATGSPTPSSFSVAGQATLPTGLVQSNYTGNYLVLDSNVLTSAGRKYVQLHIYSSAGTYLRTYPIYVDLKGVGKPDGLSADASSETNFKIALESRRNILYLLSPSLNKIFALSMPEYL